MVPRRQFNFGSRDSDRRSDGELVADGPNGEGCKIMQIEGAGHNVRRDEKQKTVAAMGELLHGL